MSIGSRRSCWVHAVPVSHANVQGLVELEAEYCAQGERFRSEVAQALKDGFAWNGSGDELRAVASKPGASIEVRVNASSVVPGANTTAVLLFTAKAHARFGNAREKAGVGTWLRACLLPVKGRLAAAMIMDLTTAGGWGETAASRFPRLSVHARGPGPSQQPERSSLLPPLSLQERSVCRAARARVALWRARSRTFLGRRSIWISSWSRHPLNASCG